LAQFDEVVKEYDEAWTSTGSAKSSLSGTAEGEYKDSFAMPDTIRVSRWHLLREGHTVPDASGPHDEAEIANSFVAA
jgi:hypothetical protein